MSEHSSSNSPAGSGAWATWVAFGAILMMLGGVFAVLGGLAAAFDDSYFVSLQNDNVYAIRIQAVGVISIIVGVIKVWAGYALIQGAEWARWVTVLICAIHAVTSMIALPAQPFFGTLMIVLDLIILYAVTVRWDEAKIGLED